MSIPGAIALTVDSRTLGVDLDEVVIVPDPLAKPGWRG
jgi:hypothetical protein